MARYMDATEEGSKKQAVERLCNAIVFTAVEDIINYKVFLLTNQTLMNELIQLKKLDKDARNFLQSDWYYEICNLDAGIVEVECGKRGDEQAEKENDETDKTICMIDNLLAKMMGDVSREYQGNPSEEEKKKIDQLLEYCGNRQLAVKKRMLIGFADAVAERYARELNNDTTELSGLTKDLIDIIKADKPEETKEKKGQKILIRLLQDYKRILNGKTHITRTAATVALMGTQDERNKV